MINESYTIGTIFGGAGIGTSSIPEEQILWSIEHDPNQVEIWNNNHSNKILPQSVLDVTAVPAWVNVIQASPPCINASPLKLKSQVSLQALTLEWQLLRKTLELILEAKPELGIIENVPAYFTPKIRKGIAESCNAEGYHVTYVVVCGFDVGLPIVRKRTFALITPRILEHSICIKKTTEEPWPILLEPHLEPELRGLGRWQQKSILGLEFDEPVLLERYGTYKKPRIYKSQDMLPVVRATCNSRHIWTVIKEDIPYNVKISGFAATMGVPETYLIPFHIPKGAMRAIGNGVCAPIIPAIIKSALG